MARSSSRVDAVVVGAGPNGLVAAITLATAGRTVRVLEADARVGGGLRSSELIEPGFVNDHCAAVFAFAADSPFLRRLPLERHGLDWVEQDVPLAHPFDTRPPALLHRSIDVTAAGLGDDGRAWRRTFARLLDGWDEILDDVLGPLLRWPDNIAATARFGARAVLPSSWFERRFRDDATRALVAGCAAHSFRPLHEPATAAFALMLVGAAHRVGWPFARGGSQRVADALAAHLVDLGGEIETHRPVRSLGDLPNHRAALFDVGPQQLARLAGDTLTPRFRRRLHRYRRGPAAYKLDYTLDEPVPWRDGECRRAGTLHLAGDRAEVAHAMREVAAGRATDRPFVLVAQPSVFDSTRAPSGRHTLWAYAHVPHGYAGDVTAAIEGQIERFAPGFRDVVRGRRVTPPAALERSNPNLVGGDVVGGSNDLIQLVRRPTLRAYRTSNPTMFLCSASTPPGGGVHGACGAHAARRALAGPLR